MDLNLKSGARGSPKLLNCQTSIKLGVSISNWAVLAFDLFVATIYSQLLIQGPSSQ